MWGHEAFERFCDELEPGSTVADIGSGKGVHSKILRDIGMDVIEYDVIHGTDYIYESIYPGLLKGVWCCHVAEHILDLDTFLKKIFNHLGQYGLLAITVPPLKHTIVGGHVNLFNPGLLLYRLILAGFNCREARVGVYGYNISVLVRKDPVDLPTLVYDQGDIMALAPYFPLPVVNDSFYGNIGNIQW